MANQEYEQGPLTKFDQPSTKGVTIAGMKGVSLASDQSEDIKARLAQMIAEREAAKSGWQPFLDALTLAGSAPGTYAERKGEYDKRQREADQELFQMRLGIGQLETDQARQEMARKQEAARLAANNRMFGRDAEGNPLNANAPFKPGMGPTPSQIEATLAAQPQPVQESIKAMLDSTNPQMQQRGYQAIIDLMKPTELQRNLQAAGLQGRDAQIAARLNLMPNVIGMTEMPIPGNQYGATQRVPTWQAAADQFFGSQPPQNNQAQGVLPTAPAPAAQGVLPIAPAPAAQGVLPIAPAPAAQGVLPIAPAPAAQGVLPTTQGALPTAQAPAVQGATLPSSTPSAITPGTPDAPIGSTQWLKKEEARLASENRMAEEKRRRELEVAAEEAKVPIEGKKAEAQVMGKTYAEEQTAFRTAAENADKVLSSSKALVDNVKRSGNLLGLLSQPQKPLSVFMNALDQGVSIGRFGSVTIPGLKDVWVQMHPDAKKVFIDNSQNPNSTQNYKYQTAANSPQRKAEEAKRVAEEQKWIDNAAKNSPTAFESFQRVAMQLRDVELAYSQVMNKGMGSFTENERKLVREAVGADPYRMSPRNVMLKAKAMEAEAANTKDRMQLWEKLQGKYSWEQFKRSPEYKKQSEAFYYRTARALGYDAKKVEPFSQK